MRKFAAKWVAGSLAEVLITQGQILRAQWEVAAAHEALTAALQLAWEVGPRLMIAPALEELAGLALQGRPGPQAATLAARWLAAASTLRMQMGTAVRPVDRAALAQTQAILRTMLTAEALAALSAEVAALPLEAIFQTIPGAAAFATTPAVDVPTALINLTTTATKAHGPRHVDWSVAQEVPVLYGRRTELATLTQWVRDDACRVISLLGLGGIGKTSLAVTCARQTAAHFAVVIFRSLAEAIPFSALLDGLIHRIAPTAQAIPTQLADRLALLLDLLRQERCLLILDNLETLVQSGQADAPYLPSYEGYATFFKLFGETAHQSCLILTSRERLRELAALEGPTKPVRSLRLVGLPAEACRAILADQDLSGSVDDALLLAQRYGGNPLALKLVADPIRALFGGNIGAFLGEGNLFFNGVGHLLAQQISRASALEQALLTWLAVLREPATLDQLMAALVGALVGGSVKSRSRADVLAALHSLWRRNLLELGQAQLTFALQRVVLEYLTERLVDQAVTEIMTGDFTDLGRHALIQATAKEYVRHSQERLIAAPILAQLAVSYGSAEGVEQHLLTQLAAWRDQPQRVHGYGPGNLINLLRLLRGNLRRLDLTRLTIRQAYLQGIELQDTTLAGALIQDTLFTETFDALTAIATSPQGDYWAAISRRGEVLVWKPASNGSQTLHRTWPAHGALTWSLAFAPAGNGSTASETLLASGSWDGTVKLWDVATGALRWLGRHTSHVNRVAFAPAGPLLASSGQDAAVRLWDVHSGTLRQTLPHPGQVAVITWSPDGQLLVSGDTEGAIRLWARQTDDLFACVQLLPAHTTWVDGLAFAPDGRTLASVSYDGTVKLWDIPLLRSLAGTGVGAEVETYPCQTLDTLRTRMHRVVWHPQGRLLATCSFERAIWLWDLDQQSYRAPLQGHTAAVYDLAFTADGTSLLSGSQDGTLRVWDVATGQCARVLESYTGSLFDVDWRPDSTQLVTVGTDGLVTIYAVTGGRPLTTLRGHMNAVFGVGWSPNGRWLASSELDNVIRLWETTSGACLKIIQHPADAANLFYGVTWSPDGARLASGTARRGVLVWDVQTQRPAWDGTPLPTKIRHVAWSPDGRKIAGGGDNGTVYVWDAADGTLRQTLLGHHSMVTSLAWNPAGTKLASGGRGLESGELFVWDPQTGARLGALAGHAEIVSALAWGPATGSHAEFLISGGGGGKLRWWELQSGTCVQLIDAHVGTVQALRRSPDGTQLASCGDDGAIKLWDLYRGDERQTLRRDRPYERLDITVVTGITTAQRVALMALGAVAQDKGTQ